MLLAPHQSHKSRFVGIWAVFRGASLCTDLHMAFILSWMAS